MRALKLVFAASIALWGGLGTTSARAQGFELTGEIAAETRVFPRGPLFPEQRNARLSPSFRLEPEFFYEWSGGRWRITVRPFLRLDPHDDARTHADLREAGLLYLGDGWTAFAGLGKVFWGVTEVSHLVDIVNQTDGVEDIDSEDKLGQPMVNLTIEGSWGAIDVLYLPLFRERTFPDGRARLRGLAPIEESASYESGAKRRHQDFAVRWTKFLGDFDLSMSYFRGTSREPRFLPIRRDGGRPVLRPRYDVINQLGLTLQWTRSRTLWKLEAITREGPDDRFVAATGGIEYTMYQLFSSNADLGLLAEVMLDGRGETAPPTIFDNDLFVGFRWAWNDVSGTSILGGPVVDFATGEVLAMVEAERRIGERWSLAVEARWFANTEPNTFTEGVRRDGFVNLGFSRFF